MPYEFPAWLNQERCRKCDACLHVRDTARLIIPNPPFEHGNQATVDCWNKVCIDNPCETWLCSKCKKPFTEAEKRKGLCIDCLAEIASALNAEIHFRDLNEIEAEGICPKCGKQIWTEKKWMELEAWVTADHAFDGGEFSRDTDYTSHVCTCAHIENEHGQG